MYNNIMYCINNNSIKRIGELINMIPIFTPLGMLFFIIELIIGILYMLGVL